MCHGGCGVLVHVNDDKVLKIEGDPDSPINRGRICPKCIGSIDHMYHPKRILYPMRRIGERGEGRWERITWDDAYQIIVEKIRGLSSQYGPETIAVGQGTGRYHFLHTIRFAHGIGSPNWFEPGTAQCFIPRIITSLITYGDLMIVDYGYGGDVYPGCLLVWGKNPYISGPDGESQFRVRSALKQSPKLIVVDPRETQMAKMADIWLPIRPGTDAALALAFINVIIEEGLYDKAFVETWTTGFDQLKARVASCTPEWAQDITWVEAEKIQDAARLYAVTKPAAMTWGNALEHNPNAFQNGRSVALLPALTGNVDIPGGNIFGEHVADEVDLLLDGLSDAAKKKRLGAETYRMLCSPHSLFPSAHIPSILDAVNTGKPYPIKGMLLFGNNGLVSIADTHKTYNTLKKLEFLSVMEFYMTPTAELADLILPGATWLEADEIMSAPLGANNFVLPQQKAVQVGECKQPEEVYIEIARRMNLEWGNESLHWLLDKQLRPTGLTFKELCEKGHFYKQVRYRKHETNGFGFLTASGKVELVCSYAEMLGYDPLPYYVEPPESPYSQPEMAKKYPYVLSTGGRMQPYFNSEYRNIEFLRRRLPWPQVEINHDTGKKLGIKSGDWVWIESPRGRIKQKVKLTNQHPQIVHVSYGWWYPEMPGPEYGLWESNANVLTNREPPYCPAIGTYQISALLCNVYKVGEDEKTPEELQIKNAGS